MSQSSREAESSERSPDPYETRASRRDGVRLLAAKTSRRSPNARGHVAHVANAATDKLWTPELFRILGAAAMWGFAHACFVLLPKYLALELGVGPREIGRTMGAFGLASVPVAALAGWLVDRRPPRVALAAGAILLALSAVGFGVSDTFGPHIYALRALQALANALVVTAVGVAVVEIAPTSRLSQAIGLTGATMLGMNAVAPIVVEPLATTAGWDTIFVIATLAALGSLGFLVGMRAPRVKLPHEVETVGEQAADDAGFPFGYATVSAASGVAFGTVMAFQQPLSLAAGREDVSGFLSAFAVGALGLRLFAGSLPDRIGRRRAAAGALAVYALATAALGVTPLGLMNAMGLLLGLSHGLFFPALNVLMLSRVPARRRGRTLGVFTGSFHFGVAVTALLGPVAETAGYATVFALAGAICALGLFALIGVPDATMPSLGPRSALEGSSARAERAPRRTG
jgi:MFS family permease